MEDILYWSKGQMENFNPEFEYININQLFIDNQKYFSDVENILFDYENQKKLSVYSDINYIKTILRNLTTNAINTLKNTSNPHIRWQAHIGQNDQLVFKHY